MAFKPNYGRERAERARAKQAKKEEKLKQRQEDAARRKAAKGDLPENGGDEQA